MQTSRRENKDWLLSFLEYSKDSETPFKMLYWSGVCAVAGALRRNVFLDQGRYELYPNFYILFVAKPGIVQKTTTINYAIKLLRNVEGINFSPKSCTWEAFINLLEGMHTHDDHKVTVDGVIEKTAAISVVAGEFDTFYDSESKGMVSALTDLWDCPPEFEKVTKFNGSEFIEKPCINLIGGTTPAWMRENFDRYSREGGFVSRTIFVHAEAKRQFVARPKKASDELRIKLQRDLEYIAHLKGEFRMSPAADTLMEKWYHEHCQRQVDGLNDATGFNERKQAHILKLAMVISVSRRDSLEITLTDLEDAIQKIEEIEGDFQRSFELIDDRQELRPFHEIGTFIQKHKEGVKQRRIFSEFASRFTHREIIAAIQSMNAADLLQLAQVGNELTVTWKGTP